MQMPPETVATSPLFMSAHRAKLFSLTDKRLFTLNEILGTVQEVKIFVEWAPKTELFRRNWGRGEQAGLYELSLDGRSF